MEKKRESKTAAAKKTVANKNVSDESPGHDEFTASIEKRVRVKSNI